MRRSPGRLRQLAKMTENLSRMKLVWSLRWANIHIGFGHWYTVLGDHVFFHTAVCHFCFISRHYLCTVRILETGKMDQRPNIWPKTPPPKTHHYQNSQRLQVTTPETQNSHFQSLIIEHRLIKELLTTNQQVNDIKIYQTSVLYWLNQIHRIAPYIYYYSSLHFIFSFKLFYSTLPTIVDVHCQPLPTTAITNYCQPTLANSCQLLPVLSHHTMPCRYMTYFAFGIIIAFAVIVSAMPSIGIDVRGKSLCDKIGSACHFDESECCADKPGFAFCKRNSGKVVFHGCTPVVCVINKDAVSCG